MCGEKGAGVSDRLHIYYWKKENSMALNTLKQCPLILLVKRIGDKVERWEIVR